MASRDSGSTDVLTVAEASALLRVDPKTIQRWIREGRLPENAWVRTPGGHAYRLHRWWVRQMLTPQ